MSKENNGWIYAEYKQPEPHKEVLVYNGYVFIAKFNGGDWITSGGLLGIKPVFGVTHWQPLPQPPEE